MHDYTIVYTDVTDATLQCMRGLELKLAQMVSVGIAPHARQPSP